MSFDDFQSRMRRLERKARQGRTYLDWNATTPPSDRVVEAMRWANQSCWANPSSVHSYGQCAKALIEHVRGDFAKYLGCRSRDLIFTSGATESNNWALHDASGLVLSRLEHPSVTRQADRFELLGKPVRWLNVLGNGQVEAGSVEACLSGMPKGTCVAVMAANHETGVIQPVPEIADIAHRMGAWLHVDAVQALGKTDPITWGGWDSISLAAHKVRGPKGVGLLAWRCGAPIPRAGLVGGAQEQGLRPGTTDVVGVAGFGAALDSISSQLQDQERLRALRDELEAALAPRVQCNVVGNVNRLGHVTSLFVPGWSGAELVAAMDLEGFCISSGSACAAGTTEVSPGIAAILGPERAAGTVRVSLGETTQRDEIQLAIAAFLRVLART